MTGEAGQAAPARRLELVTDPADGLDAALVAGIRAQAIRRALARITEADPILGDHLRQTVHTGVRCSYWPG
jgi:hypothetical protein